MSKVTEPAQNKASLPELQDPKLDFLMLCDRAEVINGKLYVMGGVIEIFFHDFREGIPAPITFGFALCVEVPWHATNQPIAVHVAFRSSDGDELGSADVTLTVGRPPHLPIGSSQRATYAVPRLSLLVPGPGAFVAVATLGDQTRRVPFSVFNKLS